MSQMSQQLGQIFAMLQPQYEEEEEEYEDAEDKFMEQDDVNAI